MVLCLLYFFLIITHAMIITDLQYTTPTCTIDNRIIYNSFGNVIIKNNLMARGLQFELNLDFTQYSCRLCEISSNYCTLPYSNDTNLSPSQDTSYNFKLVSLTNHNATYTTLYSLKQSQTSLTINNLIPYDSQSMIDGDFCGKEYRFILFLILSIESPINRDIFTIVQQKYSDIIPCNDANGQSDLSCRIAPEYYYLSYIANNCLSSYKDSSEIYNDTTYSPLYWHDHREDWPIDRPLLCQEDWSLLMDRIKPEYYYCNRRMALYIKPMPWYDTAMEVMTAFFNHRGMDNQILQTLDTLEAYCDQRDLTGSLSLEESILYNMTILLRNRHVQVHSDECYPFITYFDDIELPFYANHYNDWEMKLLKYIIYFDYDMPLKSILLLSFIIFSIVIVSIITLVIFINILAPCFIKYNDYERVS